MTNTFFGKPYYDAQFLHYYLNDLFAMPLILAYVNLLISWAAIPSIAITTPIRIAALTLFCVTIWEGITPMLLDSSTGDPLDVVVYSIGSLGYFSLFTVADRFATETSDDIA